MKKRIVSCLLIIGLLVSLFPQLLLTASATDIGPRVMEGGKRDFAWPVPTCHSISGCFKDCRTHDAIDIPASWHAEVVASYDGTVKEAYNSGDGYGKIVLIEHNYRLSDGTTIKLYSKYNHLDKLNVEKGDSVTRGETVVGYVGNSGGNYAVHLDFQILSSPEWYNSNYHKVSIDPFVNDLLELPSDIWRGSTSSCSCGYGATSNCCCQKYINYAKQQYATPLHKHSFNSIGTCSCGATNWKDSKSHDADGEYQLVEDAYTHLRAPYEADSFKNAKLKKGQKVFVVAKYTNAYGHIWYEINVNNACYGYIYGPHLKKISTGSSSTSGPYCPVVNPINISITYPAEGQTISKAVHTFTGSVSSSYKLTKITAAVDGTVVATVNPNTTYYNLSEPAIDYKITFNKFEPGRHVITITAYDSTTSYKTLTRTFYTQSYPCPEPTISSKDIVGGKQITFSCPNATVSYSTNTDGSGSGYGSVTATINKTTTFTIRTSRSGYTDTVVSKCIGVDQTQAPSFSAVEWYGGTKLTLSSESGATIYYSVDNGAYRTYSGTFNVDHPCTVRAYATAPGCIQSDTSSYTVVETKPYTPKVRLIDTPDKIAVGKSATWGWDADCRAQYYTVQLYKDGELLSTSTQSENAYSYILDEVADYKISVVATNLTGSSDASNELTVSAMAPLNVRFEDWDGSLLSEYVVDYGSYLGNQIQPSRRGHYFAGWSPVNDYKASPVTKDITYTATYNRIEYSVTFYDVDGVKFGDTQRILFEDSATPPDYSDNVPSGFEFVGWTVIEASENDSLCDYTCVDANLKLQAVIRWANMELPVYSELKSASVSKVGDESVYTVNAYLKNWPESVSKVYICVALKSQDPETGVWKTNYADRRQVTLAANETQTIPLDITYNGIASTAEFVVLECKDDGTTGSAYSEVVSKSIVFDTTWTDWTEWNTTQPSSASGRSIETKTQYRYQTKETMTSSSASVSGWTQTGSTYKWAYLNDWSSWSDTPISESDTVHVETRSVLVSNAYTTYTYGAYFSNNSCKSYAWTHFCPTCANWAYGGNWYYKTYTQSYRATPISLGQSCGHKGSFPTEYRAADGYLYYYETVNNYPAVYKTQYRYCTKYKDYTYSYYRWTDWSSWGDASVTATSSKNVQTRTVYRYRDEVLLYSDNAGQADTSGTCRHFTGTINSDLDLSGKVATVMVYQSKNMDPNQYQMQYLGQVTLTEGNAYDISFIPIREPTIESGNYVVSLGIQGTTGLISVDVVEAPKAQYAVRFLTDDGTVLSEQTVEDGGNAEVPEVPEKTGFRFTGWSARTTDIYKNIDIYAQYEREKYTVVYVDWVNGTIGFQNCYYGDEFEPPAAPSAEGHTFIGWDAILDGKTTVEDNTVVTAVYDAATYTVRFFDEQAQVIDTQTVVYGEAAELPDDLVVNGRVFLGWSTEYEWWNVREDMDVYPLVVFPETTLAPLSNMSEVSYGMEATLDLVSEEGATIYYTINGETPTKDSEVYTEALHLTETSTIQAMASIDGKNDSEVVSLIFIYDDSPTAENQYDLAELDSAVVSVSPDQDLPIRVNIQNNPGLLGYTLVLECDPETFYINATSSDAVQTTELSDEGYFIVSPYQGIGWEIAWYGNALCDADGALFTIPLKVNEEAEPGDYEIKLSYANDFVFAEEAERIALPKKTMHMEELPDDEFVHLAISDTEATGTTATVPLTISNVSNLTGAAVAVTFDTNKLRLDSAAASGSFNGEVSVEATETGALITWNGSGSASTLSTLMTLNFSIIGQNAVGAYYVGICTDETVLTKKDGTQLYPIAEDGIIICCLHEFTRTEITAPTCTHPGLAHCVCETCGYEEDQVVAALGHDYGLFSEAASCTDRSAMTYICSRCGDSYTDYTASGTGHVFASYTDAGANHIAECEVCGERVTEPHSYIDGVCICGAVEPEEAWSLAFKSASLTLENDISINFYVNDNVLEGWDSPYVIFTKELYDENGNVSGYQRETVSDYSLVVDPSGTPCHVFKFKGVSVYEMSSAVTATLYAEQDGSIYHSNTINYSVLQYVTNQLGKTTDERLKTLLVNLVNYGAASQTYWSYHTNKLANANLTQAQKAYATESEPELTSYTQLIHNDGATVSFKSASLTLKEKVTINYYLNLDNYTGSVDDLEVHVQYTDSSRQTQTAVIDSSEFEYRVMSGAYRYVANFSELQAYQLREICTAEVFSKSTGQRISNTLVYSIESYAASMSSSSDETLNFLIMEMMKYGDSARAYFGIDDVFTVTFQDYDGTELKTEQVLKWEDATPPEAPSREDYTFIGWDGQYTNVTADTVITASYEEVPKYTVTFDACDGTASETSAIVIEGHCVSTLPTASREQFIFDGWYLAKTGGEAFTTAMPITEDITVYAHWTPKSYTASWSAGTGTTISVSRTSSPYGAAETGALSSGATVYYGDVLTVTYTAKTGYNLSTKGKESITVSGNVTATDIYATASVKEFALTYTSGSNYTITVNRTSSPLKGATTGKLSSGAKIYYNDVLSVTYAASTGYSISSNGGTSYTVTDNIGTDKIYANVSANSYTYSIVYQSTNGTSLGSSSATYKFGTTNTISAPAKSGYNTPSSQSVKWDATSKTITFKYSPSAVSARTVTSGTWTSWGSGKHGISYSARVEYGSRTSSSVQMRIVWTNTVFTSSYLYFGNWQNFSGSIGGVSTGSVQIASSSTWNGATYNGASSTGTSGWIWVPVSATTTSTSISLSWSDAEGNSGSWSGTVAVPTY